MLPAPVIAGIALVPRAWELEILNEMSFSQSHGVKLGYARGKLGGQYATPAALRSAMTTTEEECHLPWAWAGQCCALAVSGDSRFSLTWPWTLVRICNALGTKKSRLGWGMRLLPCDQVHVETPVEWRE